MKRPLISPVAVKKRRWEARKYLLIVLAVTLFGTGLKAQVIKGSTRSGAPVTDTTMTIEERLVQLALGGPRYENTEHKNKIDEYQLRKAKNSWLNLLSLSLNYNDQTFAKDVQTTVVYPKYFFGFTLPLGLIFSNGTEVKVAREAIKASQSNQKQLAREIRSQVLSRYTEFKTYGELLAIQNKVVDDEEAAFRKAEKNFRDGTISIELYNSASKNYNLELTKRLNLKLQQDLKKIEIEELIGTNLDKILNEYSVRK
jgi:outer membrane protein TolC